MLHAMVHPTDQLYNTLAEPDKNALTASIKLLRDYAAARGVVLRSVQTPDSSSVLVHAPMALLPATIPCPAFQTAWKTQIAVGRMLHNMSLDDEFLQNALAAAAKADEFTHNLYKIYQATKDHTRVHPQLAMLRSDYLLHSASGDASTRSTCKLVEINTIAAGLAGLTPKIPPFHDRFIDNLLSQVRIAYDKDHYRLLSACDCAQVFANGLDAANAHYQAKFRVSNVPVAVLMVVQAADRNIADQKELELLMPRKSPQEDSSLLIMRDFDHVAHYAELSSGNALLLDGYEISVVYFRDGYAPQQYFGEQFWAARLLMERSNAIKCPTVRLQLTGTKKVQQVFSHDAGVIEKYLPQEFHDKIDAIRSTLVGNYTLDEQHVVEQALETPDRFVMKPQREGGGNNYYDAELRRQLQSVKDTDERHAYILMDKIMAPTQLNFLIRPDVDEKPQAVDGETISEFGFYSYILGSKDVVVGEESARQCLVRTKLAAADEGGFLAGYAFLNSAMLVCNEGDVC